MKVRNLHVAQSGTLDICELSCLGTVTRLLGDSDQEGCAPLVTSHFLRSHDFPQCLLVLRMSCVFQGRDCHPAAFLGSHAGRRALVPLRVWLYQGLHGGVCRDAGKLR